MVYGIVTIPKLRMENHFSFLSWNLALLNRSAHAPQHWELCDTEEVVREQVIELSPDIVLFQELPGLVPYIETHNMVRANPQSHSGHLAILISQRLSEFETTLTPLEGFGLSVTFMEIGLTVANIHLAEPEQCFVHIRIFCRLILASSILLQWNWKSLQDLDMSKSIDCHV